jgi:hypothetical protein
MPGGLDEKGQKDLGLELEAAHGPVFSQSWLLCTQASVAELREQLNARGGRREQGRNAGPEIQTLSSDIKQGSAHVLQAIRSPPFGASIRQTVKSAVSFQHTSFPHSYLLLSLMFQGPTPVRC